MWGSNLSCVIYGIMGCPMLRQCTKAVFESMDMVFGFMVLGKAIVLSCSHLFRNKSWHCTLSSLVDVLVTLPYAYQFIPIYHAFLNICYGVYMCSLSYWLLPFAISSIGKSVDLISKRAFQKSITTYFDVLHQFQNIMTHLRWWSFCSSMLNFNIYLPMYMEARSHSV